MGRNAEDVMFNVRVGALVKKIRVAQGIGQAALARRIGTSQSAISDVETGHVGPTIWLLRRIANALGFELRLVFERKNYEIT